MAASRQRLDEAEATKFRDSVTRLQNFVFQDDEKSKNKLSLLLDEIVAVDSSVCCFQHEYEGSELLAHLTKTAQIPFTLDRIVAKVCQVIFNFCAQKGVSVSTSDLHVIVQFLTDALLRCQSFVHTEILSALSVVLDGNTHRLEKFHDILLGGKGILLHQTDDTTCDEDVVVEAVKCLAALTNIRPNYADCIEVRYLSASFDTLVHLLHRAPHMKMGLSVRNKLLMHCFSGIQNIVMLKRLPNIELGTLFAAVRAYMFYGLTSQTVNIPSQLYPNVVTPYDPLASSKSSKQMGNAGQKDSNKSSAGTLGEHPGGRGRGRGEEATPGDKNRNKKPRKKKGRGRGGGEGDGEEQHREGRRVNDDRRNENGLEATAGKYSQAWSDMTTPDLETLNWETAWLKLSSSDSEFSDTEGGRVRLQKNEAVRVRQGALNCFLNIVRVIDKKVMFGYWSSFIPDVSMTSSAPQTQSLFTTILKDPSPKCRMAAVASLTSMLETTRPYLAAAEEITTHQSAFTSFSAILGSMIRELHRCLLQALVAENFKAVLTQIIKCLANLVNNVPYHRLNPGLLTRVLKQIRHFFNHKDPNVRTACLTCIGAIVGIKPPLMEVSQLIKPPQPPVGVNRSANPGDSPLFRPEDASYLLYPSFSVPQVPRLAEEGSDTPEHLNTDGLKSDSRKNGTPPEANNESDGARSKNDLRRTEVGHLTGAEVAADGSLKGTGLNVYAEPFQNNCGLQRDRLMSGEPSGLPDNNQAESEGQQRKRTVSSSETSTPVLGENLGAFTPVYTDQMLQAHARETSWVIKFCIKNITGQSDVCQEEGQARMDALARYEPLPIRLEALQVMSNLVKNYFPVIRQSFRLLQNLVQICLEDSNHIIKLHGAKVLDELTQALQRDVVDSSIAPNHVIPFQQILDFWLFILDGPLPQLLNFNPEMTVEGNNLVRSAACDCMANVGEEVFAKLPMPRKMQCVTLILGLAGDDDKLIQASAVRALGIYVMYSSLKDDVAFVLDAGKSILLCMESPSNSVRFKAAWAMANLCDTLVSNKDNGLEEFLQDFPMATLLQLVKCAAKSTRDSDKVSCNAARAIGNLLRFMPPHCFEHPEIKTAIDTAVKGLVKNMNSGTMKVRWNSCYAAGNAFQNSHLPIEMPWVSDILNMLSKVVQNCSNFKVRINAALALSSPPSRKCYGSCETYCNVWTSLVTALETAENINDFAEYKYKDSLTENLCGTILRVTSLITLPDVSALSRSVLIKGHSFRMYMEKYVKLVLTKKAQGNIPTTEEVGGHLEKLQSEAISDDQRRCLQGLLEACVLDIDSADDKTPEKSAFQQIYD